MNIRVRAGLLAGFIMAAGGAAVVFGATTSAFVHRTSMMAIGAASVVAGCVAARRNGHLSAVASAGVTRRTARGIAAGIIVLLLLIAVFIVGAVIKFKRTGFGW